MEAPAPPLKFQSAPPAREATPPLASGTGSPTCFNPRLPRGRRHRTTRGLIPICAFQSAPPAREATRPAHKLDWCSLGFNPRLPRGRRPLSIWRVCQRQTFQSAPPAREATLDTLYRDLESMVSIRASRAGGDRGCLTWARPGKRFNPRLPRGRRLRVARPGAPLGPVSIRASRAGGDGGQGHVRAGAALVSIRASRAGGDAVSGAPTAGVVPFQSAPPAREATAMTWASFRRPQVSIRASRAGGDRSGSRLRRPGRSFNPRLPRGRRRGSLRIGGNCRHPRYFVTAA